MPAISSNSPCGLAMAVVDDNVERGCISAADAAVLLALIWHPAVVEAAGSIDALPDMDIAEWLAGQSDAGDDDDEGLREGATVN